MIPNEYSHLIPKRKIHVDIDLYALCALDRIKILF